jgi:hypothetical protein
MGGGPSRPSNSRNGFQGNTGDRNTLPDDDYGGGDFNEDPVTDPNADNNNWWSYP